MNFELNLIKSQSVPDKSGVDESVAEVKPNNTEAEFQEKIQQRKENLFTNFFKNHPQIGRKARELAFVLMGITGAFATENSFAQTPQNDSTRLHTIMNMIEYSQSNIKGFAPVGATIELQLPVGVTKAFSSSFDVENLNGQEQILSREQSGTLDDSGHNLFVTTEFRSYLVDKKRGSASWEKRATNVAKVEQKQVKEQGKTLRVKGEASTKSSAISSALSSATEIVQSQSENTYRRWKTSTIIGKSENLIKASGDTLRVNSAGETEDAAIGSALENLHLGNIKAEVVTNLYSQEKANQQEAQIKVKKSLVDNINISFSTYIYSYRVVSEQYDQQSKLYIVNLEVLPGILSEK